VSTNLGAIHTAILCAITAGIDLAPAVVEKFNSTSEKNGLSTTLSATEPSPRTQALEEGVWKKAIERAVIELEANWPHKTTPEMRDAIRALSSQPVADRHKTVDELAAYLCDEFDFDLNPVQGASWPEHENDEGKRDGGYVRLQPSDVQAYARENAKRILTFLSLPASPEVSG
jgi:hypothetical protein